MTRLLQIGCLIFLLCVGMTCDSEFYYPVDIASFTLTHMDNQGEEPVVRLEDESILKEAYVLKMDLRFLDEYYEDGFTSDFQCKLKNPIKEIRIFSTRLDNEVNEGATDVTNSFKSYQMTEPYYKNSIVPISMSSLEYLTNSIIYMALLDIPDPGTYQYKVILTLEVGEPFVQETDPVTLY